jgi:hemerythrin HHE cation binding domain-containing protein
MPDIREQNRAALAAVRVRRDALLDAILELEQALASPATERAPAWASEVGDALGNLRDVFEHHVEDTEREGGFFEELLDDEPRLTRAVERMRADHVTIATTSDELAERLRAATGGDAGADVEPLRAGLLDLIRALLVHRHRGSELVYEAYNVDLSVGD